MPPPSDRDTLVTFADLFLRPITRLILAECYKISTVQLLTFNRILSAGQRVQQEVSRRRPFQTRGKDFSRSFLNVRTLSDAQPRASKSFCLVEPILLPVSFMRLWRPRRFLRRVLFFLHKPANANRRFECGGLGINSGKS